MENASKALIIAGAILLSILLISLGIFVFTQAQDTMGSINLNEQEVMAFNNKFIAYEGDIRGSQVKQLLQAIRTNNDATEQEGTNRKISLTGTLGTDPTKTASIKTGAMYTVTLGYDNKTSLVNTIDITAKTTTP